jgi:TP901 family phage tail tape measure protein
MSRFVLTAQLQLQAPNNVAQVVRQIQSQLNNVNVNLNIQNAARTQRQLQQITTQAQAAGTAADRMGRAFALSVRRFAAFSIATRAVGLFTSTLSKAVQTAIDFERELVKISQVTGESISKLKGLTNTIGELSTTLGVSSTSLIGVSRILSQAGFKANELDIALKTLAKTELAPTFDDITQTAEGAIAIFNQFGQGAEALERQLGAINAVAGKFAVEAGDLIDVVRRVGGVFKSSGGELNELIALFTSVRATTRESAESIGTGLRTIFTRIQRPKTIEFLKQFGVELVDLEGKFVGPFEAVRRLSTALAGLGEGDLTFIRIAEELGGFRQIGKVLPLLQQFSVAQNALNVANKAGNSLTEDAAKAQQALAVRIIKVKEEFIALIRSVTETTTFQVMANTALALASALIKIGEAIKPLLPLLAAVAAVNFAKGIGTFAGGLMRGMQSGRTYNKGGKVHHFARGGMVPGTGNRDTVPAMLQPGEFVIKKSSVNQLGASNLAAMNENKLNKGGVPTLTARNALIGQRRLTPAEMIKASRRAGYDIERLDNGRIALSRNGKIYHNNLTDDEASKLLASMGTGYNRGTTGRGIVGATAQLKSVEKRKTPYSAKEPFPGTGSLRFNVNEGQIGAFVLQPAKGTEGFYKPNKAIDFVLPPTNKYAQVAAKQAGLDPSKDISGGVKAVLNPGSYPVFYPGMEEGRANLKKNAKYASAVTRGFNDAISSGVNSTIQSVVSQGLLDMPPAYNTNENLLKNTISSIQSDNQVRGSIEGYLFEGMISAFTGAQAAGGRASFDFPRSAISQNKDKLATLFGSPQMINKLIKAEAKRSYGEVSGVTNKLINDIKVNKIGGVSIQTVGKKFASGGGVGTDTVPALLTPGEFVINEESAQAIGYGTLNRMNKVGKYAKGGVVQGFNTGTTGTGVKSSGGLSFPGFDSKPLSMLQKAILDITTTFSTGSQIANKVNSKWKMIDNSVPALAHALDRYISTLGLTDKQAVYLTDAYGNLVSKMVKEGATTDEMTARLSDYIHSLQAATKAHNQTATQATTSSPTSTVAAATTTASSSSTTKGSGQPLGLMAQITQEREKIEKENVQRISKVYYQSYDDIKKAHEKQVADAKAAGKSTDEIKKIFEQSNKAIRSLKEDTIAQVKAIKESSPKQAKENVIQARKSQPDMVFAEAKKRAASGETLSASTDFGKQAYAKLTTEQLKQVNAIQKATIATNSAAQADQQEAKSSNQVAQANQKQSAMMTRDFGSMAIGLSMVSGTIQAMLPPLDESSGLLLKMSHGLLGVITTVTGLAFALSAFGVTITGSTIASAAAAASSFLLGTAGASAATSVTALGVSAAWAAKSLGLSQGWSMWLGKGIQGLSGFVGNVVKLAGPIVAVAGGAYLAAQAFRTIYDSIYDFDGRLKKSIESGDVEGAKKVAAEKGAANTNVNSVKNLGTLAASTATGAAIGSFIPVIGTAVGALIGFGVGLLSISDVFTESTGRLVALAAAQAGAVRVTKALESAQKSGAAAMEKFNKGLINSGELLDAFASASGEVSLQNTRVAESVKENAAARSDYGSGKILRNIGAYLGGGLFGMETAGTRNKRLEKESVDLLEQQKKSVAESFSISRDARNASMRSAIFRGVDPEKELKERGMDTGSMRQERLKILKAAGKAEAGGRKEESKRLFELAAQYEEEINNTEQAMANLKKEVELAKAKFAALNLGFRSVTASADAAAMRMTNSMNSFDLAVVPGVGALNTLQASLTAAGQNIDQVEFDSALGEVSGILKKFGADARQITAFEDLTKGVATVQRDFPNIFEDLKSKLNSTELRDQSPEKIGEEFKKLVAQSLDKAGIGDAAKQRIIDAMGDVNLGPEDIAKIMAGDVSVLEKYFGDAAEEVGKQIKEFGEKWVAANQELIKATQERIESERNFVSAQKEAINVMMEAREIQAKYGGAPVSIQERRGAILGRANAGAASMGLTRMRTGSVAELRQRNMQILGGFAGIEARRGQAGSEMGAKGADLQGTQQNLIQAQKDQVQTIRDLIKLEEEELKILQEKNKLEKDSLESLITGDIEKFFEQQAALGAQASIAAGNMEAANMFGAKAVADAFKDLQRQMDAGVQSLFGRQLGGAGGLLESAAGAALAGRGVTDPRMAQRLAGTTAEEEEFKARIRDLSDVLGEAAITGMAMAEMQVQTAQMKVEKAEINIANLGTGGAPAQARATGGLIYANRGMFVPRGTDTVPAMLTPGEFVIRREAVNRGNNLQLLKAINGGAEPSGLARGGKVGYYNNGGRVQYKSEGGLLGGIGKALGIDQKLITNLGNVFNTFINGFSESIKNLRDTKLQVKLDSVNVNVNFTGTSMLTQISNEARSKIIDEVVQKLKSEYGVRSDGKIGESKSLLPRPGG